MGNGEEEEVISTMMTTGTSIEELLKASRDDEDAFELWFQDRIIVRGKEAGQRAIEFLFGGHPDR